MSGFDTSQPIADEESLKDVDTDEAAEKKFSPATTGNDTEEAQPSELGDATPGPR